MAVLSKGLTDISNYDWRTFKYCINLYMTRAQTIKPQNSTTESIQITPVRNFNATFSFVHFLAITGKFKVLKKLDLTVDDILEPVDVTNKNEDVARKDAWIFEATSVHLGAMFSPEALAVLLKQAEKLGALDKVREQTNFENKRRVTPLHVAAMSLDPYSVR